MLFLGECHKVGLVAWPRSICGQKEDSKTNDLAPARQRRWMGDEKWQRSETQEGKKKYLGFLRIVEGKKKI